MTPTPLPHVRQALPWLPLPPFVVSDTDLARLRAELRTAGYRVAEADASAAVTERGLLALIGVVLAFPEYYGQNWDALEDCVGMIDDDDQPVALVLSGCDAFLGADLHGFVRSVHLLTDLASRTATAGSGFRLDVFFTGDWPVRAYPGAVSNPCGS